MPDGPDDAAARLRKVSGELDLLRMVARLARIYLFAELDAKHARDAYDPFRSSDLLRERWLDKEKAQMIARNELITAVDALDAHDALRSERTR